MKDNIMKRRDCCTVIMQMIKEIPETEGAFIKDLMWNYEDASYKAPEDTLQWHRTYRTIEKYMHHPKEEWEFKVSSIFSTLPVDEIKLLVAKNFNV